MSMVWAKLRFKKPYSEMKDLPESFLETGTVTFRDGEPVELTVTEKEP